MRSLLLPKPGSSAEPSTRSLLNSAVCPSKTKVGDEQRVSSRQEPGIGAYRTSLMSTDRLAGGGVALFMTATGAHRGPG